MKEEKKKREKKAGVIVSRPSVKQAAARGPPKLLLGLQSLYFTSAMLPRPPPRRLAWFRDAAEAVEAAAAPTGMVLMCETCCRI
jgi:hypothetical protein